MPIARATIEVEFEADDLNAARAALIRLSGDVNISLAHGSGRGIPTHVKRDSIRVSVTNKTIDGQPA